MMKRLLTLLTLLFGLTWTANAQFTCPPSCARLTSNATNSIVPQGGFGSAFRAYVYGKTFQAPNAVNAVTWSISVGTLPAGLTLGASTSNTATIVGTPTGTGSSAFTLKGVDSIGQIFLLPTTITVYVSTGVSVTPTGQSIKTGATLQLTALSLESDSITTLQISSIATWACSGTGYSSISMSGLFTASGSTGSPSCTAAFDSQTSAGVTITIGSSVPTITNSATLPAPCDINFPCPGLQLNATGGVTLPYVWTITSGAPAGCTTSVSSTGFYACTPTTATTYSSFIIQVCDSAGSPNCTSKTFTQVVGSLSSIAVTGMASISVNGSTQLTATGTYSGAGTHDITIGTGGGTVAWTYIRGNNVINSSTTTAVVPLNNVVAGDTIICAPIYVNGAGSGQTLTSVKDQAAAAFTATTHSPTTFLASVGQAWMYYQLSAAGGNETFTGTWSTVGAAFGMGCDEFRASGGTPAYDVDAAQSSGASGTANTGLTITPAGAGKLIYAVDVPVNAITAAGAPFTLGSGGFFDAAATEYLLSSVAGANSINFAQAPAGAYAAIEAAFSVTPTSGGVGTVWTATTLTGNAPCSVNGSGLVQGLSAGTCSAKAAVGAVNGTLTVTVTAPTDTTITVAPPTGSQLIGGQFTFSATGNPSGTIDTGAPTVWSSSSPSTLSMVGNIGTCKAAGSAVITATVNSNLSGSTNALTNNPIICVTAVAGGGNLSNCVVTGSTPTSTASVTGCANSWPPAGWTLVIADGANGAQPSNVALAGITKKLPFGHSGANSYGLNLTGNGSEAGWYVSGSSLTTFSQVDISYWEYDDSNAMYANSDYYLVSLRSNLACSGQGQAVGINAQLYNVPVNTASVLKGAFFSSPVLGNPANNACQGAIWQQGFNMGINAGVWRQYEFLIIPNTTETGGQVFPPPNCNNLSPSTIGCGNGTMTVWVNGVQVVTYLNANLQGTQTLGSNSDTAVEVGGVMSSFSNMNFTTPCNSWSATGGGSCPGTQPGTGAPQPFHRYLADIVVIKQ